jgi:hypothetical protein
VAAAGGTQTKFSDQAASAGTRKTATPGLVLVAAAARANTTNRPAVVALVMNCFEPSITAREAASRTRYPVSDLLLTSANGRLPSAA